MTAEVFKVRGAGHLPGLAGLNILTLTLAGLESRLEVRKELMAPNRFLHAASVIALFRCTQMVLWPKPVA
jgi:hypothetical protein